jgi:hypothetical protein
MKPTDEHADNDDGLPMFHPRKTGRASAEEKAEYKLRQQIHYSRHPDYKDKFRRPPPWLFREAWAILRPLLPTHIAVKDVKKKLILSAQEKVAVIILVDLFLHSINSGRRVTYNHVFDEVCRKYSDHFINSPAHQSRDMMPATLRSVRRDLQCNEIDFNKLWALFRALSVPPYEGLFSIKFAPNRQRLRFPLPSEASERFSRLTSRHRNYFCSRGDGIVLWFDKSNAARSILTSTSGSEEYCAESPYNRVILGTRSLEMLQLQAKTRLFFDIDAFSADYKSAVQHEKLVRDGIVNDFQFDPRMPNWKEAQFTKSDNGTNAEWSKSVIWSARDRFVYYTSIIYGFDEDLTTSEIADHFAKKQARLNERKGRSKASDADAVNLRYEGFVLWLVKTAQALESSRGTHKGVLGPKVGFRERLSQFVRKYHSSIVLEYSRVRENFAKSNSKASDSNSTDKRAPDEGMKFLKAFKRGLAEQDEFTREEIVKASIAGWEWRQKVRRELSRYDEVRDFLRLYQATYAQVQDKKGTTLVRSRFTRSINRRYQPLHMWPTYVGEWRLFEDAPTDFRKRWFQARSPSPGLPCKLVGYDISSSQTQIIAIVFGIEALESETTNTGKQQRPFKETLAQWAFENHQNRLDGFELRDVKPGHTSPPYSGGKDKRLQELCKALWMKTSYGSSISEVVPEQDSDPEKYGPGWHWANAHRYLKFLNNKFPEMKMFLDASAYIGRTIAKTHPTLGARFSDPLDKSLVRWNPVRRTDYRLKSDDHTLMVSLPFGTGITHEFKRGPHVRYPVDKGELSKMIAPCLVHMLDAFYSSLVMKKLADRKIEDIVGIHDCWLVPERIRIDGKIENGANILLEVMKEASEEWYRGLAPFYIVLRFYLTDHPQYGPWIQKAYDLWKGRVEKKYVPLFLAKPD